MALCVAKSIAVIASFIDFGIQIVTFFYASSLAQVPHITQFRPREADFLQFEIDCTAQQIDGKCNYWKHANVEIV